MSCFERAEDCLLRETFWATMVVRKESWWMSCSLRRGVASLSMLLVRFLRSAWTSEIPGSSKFDSFDSRLLIESEGIFLQDSKVSRTTADSASSPDIALMYNSDQGVFEAEIEHDCIVDMITSAESIPLRARWPLSISQIATL